MHMHLLETAYQKEYARRRGDCTALEYIDRFGLVNQQLTLGHGVWLNEKDIDRWPQPGLRLPQLLLQFPPALGRGGAEPLRERRASTPRSASTRPASTTTATCCRR